MPAAFDRIWRDLVRDLSLGIHLGDASGCHRKQKTDVAGHSKVIHHVGLLVNAPTDSSRFAIY